MTENTRAASPESPSLHPDKHDKTMLSEARLRRWASWTAISGTCAFGAYFFVFMAIQSLHPLPNWLITTIEKQFPATIGTPLSAIAAFCIVTLLKATNGPIEFEFLGFKFRGASGPIVMWFICFLAMIFAMWLLWK